MCKLCMLTLFVRRNNFRDNNENLLCLLRIYSRHLFGVANITVDDSDDGEWRLMVIVQIARNCDKGALFTVPTSILIGLSQPLNITNQATDPYFITCTKIRIQLSRNSTTPLSTAVSLVKREHGGERGNGKKGEESVWQDIHNTAICVQSESVTAMFTS